MKRLLYLLLISTPYVMPAQTAEEIVQRTLEQHGGQAWNNVAFVKMHYFLHGYWLEQSESPEGPYLTGYEDVDEIHSVTGTLLYQKKESKHFQTSRPVVAEIVINGEYGTAKYGPGKASGFTATSGYLDRQKTWLRYCPERLLKALAGAKVTLGKPTVINGVSHYQVAFKSDLDAGTVFINVNTNLITQVELDTYLPNEYYFSIWGKFKTRVIYSLYNLHRNSKFYPYQWNVEANGQPWQQITLNRAEFLPTTDESVFAISDSIRQSYEAQVKNKDLVVPLASRKEIAPAISLVEDNWNTGWVEQQDGIVVIEAPIGSGYSKQVMQQIKKMFPAKPIKGVVVTSDAWPHLGGVREYVAAKVPVYSSPLNEGILNKLLSSDYSVDPDTYQLSKVKPVYRWVAKPLTIDDPVTPLTIYPVNGEAGERMAVVYFPKQKLLYATDLIQYWNRARKIFFFPEYLHEVAEVVRKNQLQVETIYAMHLEPTPWKDVEDFLAKLK